MARVTTSGHMNLFIFLILILSLFVQSTKNVCSGNDPKIKNVCIIEDYASGTTEELSNENLFTYNISIVEKEQNSNLFIFKICAQDDPKPIISIVSEPKSEHDKPDPLSILDLHFSYKNTSYKIVNIETKTSKIIVEKDEFIDVKQQIKSQDGITSKSEADGGGFEIIEKVQYEEHHTPKTKPKLTKQQERFIREEYVEPTIKFMKTLGYLGFQATKAAICISGKIIYKTGEIIIIIGDEAFEQIFNQD